MLYLGKDANGLVFLPQNQCMVTQPLIDDVVENVWSKRVCQDLNPVKHLSDEVEGDASVRSHVRTFESTKCFLTSKNATCFLA